MKTGNVKKALSMILCMVLVAALALCMAGCGKKSAKPLEKQAGGTVGSGNTVFTFVVKELDGSETEFEVHTDKKVVGEALEEVKLIAGEENSYGLYVKDVNGSIYDYEKDGVYWAFYINGEYAMTGVDATEIADGEVYTFQAEKG